MHVYISGGFVVDRPPRRRARRSTSSTTSSTPEDPKAEDYIVYRIFDVLTDAFYPDHRGARGAHRRARGRGAADHARGSEQLAEIYRLQQNVAGARAPHRAPSATTSSAGTETILNLPGLSRGTREYLRDVGDHLAQIAGELQRQHEDLLALTAHLLQRERDRLNAVATRLTIGGTFFLAWTLVTGFFGQNFGWLVDNIDTRHDFLLFGLGALRRAHRGRSLTLFWVKRKDWFCAGISSAPPNQERSWPSIRSRWRSSTSSPASSPPRWPPGSSARSATASRSRPSSSRRWRSRSPAPSRSPCA